jgi:hypothetical protein
VAGSKLPERRHQGTVTVFGASVRWQLLQPSGFTAIWGIGHHRPPPSTQIDVGKRKQGLAMAEIINLNQFRKAKQKRQRQDKAATNRVRHGRPKETVQLEESERDNRQQEHDSKHLDPKDGGSEPA